MTRSHSPFWLCQKTLQKETLQLSGIFLLIKFSCKSLEFFFCIIVLYFYVFILRLRSAAQMMQVTVDIADFVLLGFQRISLRSSISFQIQSSVMGSTSHLKSYMALIQMMETDQVGSFSHKLQTGTRNSNQFWFQVQVLGLSLWITRFVYSACERKIILLIY